MSLRHVLGVGVVLGVAISATAAFPAAAEREGALRFHVRAPKVVVPGRLVTLHVSGYRRASRLHVQFGVLQVPPSNCCLTLPIPPISKPGMRASAGGVLRVRMPKRYARCVQGGCPAPGYTPFKHGQKIFVLVYEGLLRNEAKTFARVA
jgi:hypothetical protein